MSPALSKSSVLQRFEHGKVVEICNGIIFNLPMTATYVVQVGIFLSHHKDLLVALYRILSHTYLCLQGDREVTSCPARGTDGWKITVMLQGRPSLVPRLSPLTIIRRDPGNEAQR